MSVTINGLRGGFSYSGDLSGSLIAPTVVGIAGIPIDFSNISDGYVLKYNSLFNSITLEPDAGNSSVYTTAGIVGDGTIGNEIMLDQNISISTIGAYSINSISITGSQISGAFYGDGSNLTGIQQNLTNYLHTGSLTNYLNTGSLITDPGKVLIGQSGGLAQFRTISGDITINASGSATLANAAWTYGTTINNGMSIPVITTNIKGQVTSFTNTAISIPSSQVYNFSSAAQSAARSAITAGTNITMSAGQVSLVDNPSVTNLTASNAFISSDLSVAGNLLVNGTMTSVNSTNLEITDKYILIASGAADAAALHGAGIQFGSVPSEDARIIYDSVNDEIEIYPAVYSATYKNSPYDIGGEVTGSIISGSSLMNYIAPRSFTMQGLSQYTGSGAATAVVTRNGQAVTYPENVSENDLITVTASTTGSLAYFTIKGVI